MGIYGCNLELWVHKRQAGRQAGRQELHCKYFSLIILYYTLHRPCMPAAHSVSLGFCLFVMHAHFLLLFLSAIFFRQQETCGSSTYVYVGPGNNVCNDEGKESEKGEEKIEALCKHRALE